MNTTKTTRPESEPSSPGHATWLAGRRREANRGGEAGMALVTTILIMALMSGLLIGFYAMVAADQRASGVNRDQTQAYAAAHAGLEKLTASLGAMFTGGNYAPSAAQITALTAAPPALTGFQYLAADGTSGYTIAPGAVQTATIQNGPFQGLVGLITPYEINVTAKGTGGLGGGAEVHLRRQLQTVAVPVFQFGIYSENDLSFFAGPQFDFGGRVHTNQNAYLAQDGSQTLMLRDVFTAVGEIVRTHLANGLPITTSGHRGYVAVATTSATNPIFQCLSCGAMGGNCGTVRGPSCAANPNATQDGSVNAATIPPNTLQMVGGLPTMVLTTGNTANEPRWTSVSTGTLSNRIRNGRTGARRLDLPLVSDGALPIDIIRRPSIATPDTQVVLDQRYFKMASLRVLLSDRAADITGLQTVTATPPVNLALLARDPGYQATLGVTWVNGVPLALAGTYNGANGFGYRVPAGTPIADGFLKIERQDRAGVWTDVTVEILNRGFTGRSIAQGGVWNARNTPFTTTPTCASANDDPSPASVIRLQRVRDNPSIISGASGVCGHAGNAGTVGAWSTAPTDFIPLTLYDSREGARRDDATGAGANPLMGGVMHYVELDVNNLRLWLATHTDTQDLTGFVVFFSDRRGNKNLGGDAAAEVRAGPDGALYTADDFGTDDVETGELGFEDIINPASAQSVSNGVLDTGEDLNGNGILDSYGGVPRLYPTAGGAYGLPNDPGWAPAHVPAWPATLAAALLWPPALGYQPNSVGRPSTDSLWAEGTPVTLATPVAVNEARVNPPVFFRRALKIVNGGFTAGTLRLPRNLSQGLSVVAENPAYVQGDYNGPDAAGTAFGTTPGTDHVSAAVIADAVTLLSNAFNDIATFMAPHDVGNAARNASTTWYRMAVISGKGLNFPRPTSNAADHTDFGTDGGAHNFLRYIEDWGGQALNYRGSIVSFYLNRQAVGTYKCCEVVYSPPSRGYRFDTDFLTPALLPPRTPMFRDVNTLTFRQLLRPGQ